MSLSYDFRTIFSQFRCDGVFERAEPYGEGHINETFAVYVKDAPVKRYIFQRINNRLFTDVSRLMSNITLVTDFTRAEVKKSGGDPDRESLTVIRTKEGASYHFDGKNYWRAYIFIEGATSFQKVEKPEHFYYSAVAFGNFAKLLKRFDASKLYEVLPDFHNTVKRYENFAAALKADVSGRAKSVKPEIDFALEYEKYAPVIVNLLKAKEMPLKVTHNDTKLNNVMLDDITGKPVAVIDLDTVMPGSICYDFGDSIRFGCNTGAEDERDLSKVNFDRELFKAYAEGYLFSMGDSITACEKENLALGALMMTLECGVRFLTDHLAGDTYFRIHRENHNLDRARTQFRLAAQIGKALPELNGIISKL